ncbi:MAG: hypothetical protein ABW168_07060 [Sedimenticola sp.]
MELELYVHQYKGLYKLMYAEYIVTRVSTEVKKSPFIHLTLKEKLMVYFDNVYENVAEEEIDRLWITSVYNRQCRNMDLYTMRGLISDIILTEKESGEWKADMFEMTLSMLLLEQRMSNGGH